VRDGGFVHVADAVLLVLALHVGPELLGLPLRHGVEGVQVSVLPLGAGHNLYHFLQIQPHHGLRLDLKRIGGAFHDLVNVGVVEVDSFVLALNESGGLLEVSDSPGFLAFLETIGNCYLSAGLQPRRPETILDANVVECHRLDVVVARQFGLLILCRAERRAQR